MYEENTAASYIGSSLNGPATIGSANVQPMSAVEEALNASHSNLSQLYQVIGKLEQRLSTVLADVPVDPSGANKDASVPYSVLEHVRTIAGTVQEATKRIEYIIGRLEI